MSHKRTEHPEDNEDDVAQEPEQQVASAEVLAQRKIIKAKRTLPNSEEVSASAPATTGGFKGFSNITPQPGGGATAGFGFGFGGSGFGSFGAPSTTAPAAPEGGERVKTRMEPGSEATASAPAPAPAFGFGFGKAPAADSAAKPSGFGFGFGKAPAAPADAPKAAAPSTFGFGFGGASAAPKTGDETKTEEKKGDEKKEGEAPKAAAPSFGFTFGQGNSFQSAVTSFVEARQKIDESKGEEAEKEAEGGDDDEKEADAEANLATAIVEATPGEVLASAPAKLYHLKKKEGGGNEWVECGQGESKLKKQKKTDDESSTDCSYRFLVRDGYALNALVSSKTFILQSTKPKNFAFSVPTAGEGVETYNIKFTGASGEEHCAKVLKEIKAILEADK